MGEASPNILFESFGNLTSVSFDLPLAIDVI